ncbi:Lon protease family protein [Clostridium sp. Cult2]|uniref:Lon protease family protein n=1 Tax=Clostridium sp. Cult2 TaxID=2079003 RepID=UPI001F227172|nr:ATP-binding protein [Clostridium sp. Cult2]MCF6465467.1 ATP-dependent protease [Clostridium sp. Cult2]
MEKYLVPLEKLKKKCNPNLFEYNTTEDLPTSRELIGQDRAMEALKYGLSIRRKGYNIYVSGLTGTGRNSYSYLVAKEFADKRQTPKDWCYVFNFKRPKFPKAISMDSGQGKIFKKDVEKVIKDIGIEIPQTLTSKEYENNKNLIYTTYQNRAQKILNELNDLAKQYSFIFRQTERGILSIPLKEGKPMTDQELDNLSQEEIEELMKTSGELNQKAFDYVKRVKNVENDLIREIKNLKEKNVLHVLNNYMDIIIEKYDGNDAICEYLNDMKADIVRNYDMFMKEDEKNYLEGIFFARDRKEDFMKRYQVNLFMDNGGKSSAPVIREMNPTYYNLFGKIEYVNEYGGLKTDHMKIRPGSLHEANGGYIIIQAKDILQSSQAWEGLKRAITTEEIKVENITGLNVISETLRPEPIPLDIKVIIIGDYFVYQLLYNYDDDFRKLFKIRADFDIEMDKNEENIRKIGSFVAYQCKEENLKPFDKEALAAIIERSSRIAENQNKLTAKFNELVEIIYEADLWADLKNRDVVTKEDVDIAIVKKNFRNNTYEEKLIELIEKDVIMIDTEGEKVGEINGLSVIDSGQYVFGRPSKITVNTFVGKEGIINIEREVEQSGSIYDKGVLILGGYLGEKYAKDFPLSLTASITFEQSYSGIDGDSASSTELYALLSNLADKPIKQAIAVTGSVNQKGIIQPIGGVNEKIEGFYKICKLKGLTGNEGVIIPYQNIENLMLDDEIIEAIQSGKFNIFGVKTVDEGIEILTGIKSGKLNDKNEFEEGTINYFVQKKLKYYSDISKEYE